MAKWINIGKDGVIFVNCLKPLAKAWKVAPPPVKVAIAAVAIVVMAGYGIYKTTKRA